MQSTALAPNPHGVRLSPQQRRLWALHQRGFTACTRGLVRLQGRLDPHCLARALDSVIARHEVLRTTFRRDARLKFPLQVVAMTGAAAWRHVDVAGLPAEEQQAAVEELWRQAGRVAFDLEAGPLLHMALVRRAEERHDLVLTLPALCADSWTLRLLVRALAEAYPDGSDRRRPEEEPVQYAQFAEWANDLPGGATKRRVAGEGAHFVLPFEGVGEEEEGAAHEALEADIGPTVVHRLEMVGRDQGASLAAVLLAAWQVHLGRLSGRREFLLSVASAGRSMQDLQDVMGPVATWVPVPCRAEDALAFGELVREAQLSLEEAAVQEDYLETDLPADGTGISAAVGFDFEEPPEPALAGGIIWALERRSVEAGTFKLALTAHHHRNEVRLALSHDSRRISSDGVGVLAAQYVALLGSVAEAGGGPVGRLSLLGLAERARRVTAGRGAARDSGGERCLHQSFESHAARQPDGLAVVCGEQRLTHGELNRRANQLAHHLRRRGVRPGSPVGLCCERSADMMVGLLGILKAGGAYVPLDPHAPVQRLWHQLRHGGFSILVTNAGVGARLPVADYEALPINEHGLFGGEPATNPDVPVPLDELASIVFTSGSTGVPKGVAITHRGVASYTRSLCEALGIEQGLHFATVSTLSADLGNTSIFASLATGGCLHIIGYETATDGSLFSEYCRRWPLDVLKIVPSHLSALLETGAEVLPGRLLVLGGEALPFALAERVRALSAGDAMACAVVNHYGPTETTVGSLVLPLGDLRDRRGCASVPIGRPLANAEAYVLDERLEPAATGTVGELYLGGLGLARGYLRRPDLTAERFVPHPFGDGERLYRTGDRARYRPDGTIEFMGRGDHQVKIRGFRVELGEIEARLREHSGIRQAVVAIREDGAAGRSVIAYVVASEGGPDEEALRAFLRERLPEYMMPSEFVALPALPLTANGKVDRQALPNPAERRKRREHVAPRTPVEEAIAKIWAEMLRVPQVGVEDNFFDLGGHSLLAIPLMHRIHKALGGSLSLMAIFKEPTVAGLARLLGAEGPASSLVPLRATGSRPPLFCVDPTGRHVTAYQRLADALPEDQPVFGLELGRALAGEGETVSIQRIVERLAREVRKQQPHGPYHLLGWSLGGVLSLGLARVLEEQGAPVGFVGILDTQPRAGLYAAGEPDVVEELAGYVDPDRRAELLALAPSDLDDLRARLEALDSDERLNEAVTWAQARGFLPGTASLGLFRFRYDLLRDASLFMKDLPAPCLRAAIHVWWSTETLARHGGPPVDWQRYTSATVHPTTVTGDHLAAVQGRDVHAGVRAILQILNSR